MIVLETVFSCNVLLSHAAMRHGCIYFDFSAPLIDGNIIHHPHLIVNTILDFLMLFILYFICFITFYKTFLVIYTHTHHDMYAYAHTYSHTHTCTYSDFKMRIANTIVYALIRLTIPATPTTGNPPCNHKHRSSKIIPVVLCNSYERRNIC